LARAGETITNPVSGERITFRKTAADTGGELLEIDLELTPHGRRPPASTSTRSKRSGSTSPTAPFASKLRGKTIVAKAGDVVVVPPGARHKFANGGDEPAHARVEIRPALRMEQLFETAIELAKVGRTNSKGKPKPLDLALFTREFRQETVGPFAPVWLQRLTLAPLAWLASRRGRGDRYIRSSRGLHSWALSTTATETRLKRAEGLLNVHPPLAVSLGAAGGGPAGRGADSPSWTCRCWAPCRRGRPTTSR
jgi:hypothetical protein